MGIHSAIYQLIQPFLCIFFLNLLPAFIILNSVLLKNLDLTSYLLLCELHDGGMPA